MPWLGGLLILTGWGDEAAAVEAAVKAAAAQVAPCVVQIRTIGGAEFVAAGAGMLRRGSGPTTGLIVSADGYIISSSFNFSQRPTTVTVQIPNRPTPLAAQIVNHDETRMLTLLKVEAADLPVPTAAPKRELRVGQSAVALGRTWSDGGGPPSVSLGIVSALGRIWGKAVQTDAKVSPVNYGGPLIDLDGRVIGVLVPLAPRGEGMASGVEWYDSGIGFAVPLEDILRVLERFKGKTPLRAGRLGLRWKGREEPIFAQPIVDFVLPGSPAAQAGVQAGDRVTAVDGTPVQRQAQVLHLLGPKYEGDTVRLTVERAGQKLELPEFPLAGPPPPQRAGALAALPVRDDGGRRGVELRYVATRGPAAQAGLAAGDRIMQLDGRPVDHRDRLLDGLASLPPGTAVELGIRRSAGTSEKVKVVLGELRDQSFPDELPPATRRDARRAPPRGLMPEQESDGDDNQPPLPGGAPLPAPAAPAREPAAPTGTIVRNDPVTGLRTWLHVPENYDPKISHALVVWLHPAGDPQQEAILAKWQAACAEQHLILLAPAAGAPTGWLTSDADRVLAEIQVIRREYQIDPRRVVVHGVGSGADFALFLALDTPQAISGAAVVGGVLPPLPRDLPEGRPTQFFLTVGGRDPRAEPAQAALPVLQGRGHPTRLITLPEAGSGYPNDPAWLRDVWKWIDTLDAL